MCKQGEERYCVEVWWEDCKGSESAHDCSYFYGDGSEAESRSDFQNTDLRSKYRTEQMCGGRAYQTGRVLHKGLSLETYDSDNEMFEYGDFIEYETYGPDDYKRDYIEADRLRD